MNQQEMAALARKEYSDPQNAVRRGGINGSPYWNRHSMAFMFCPSFDFPPIPYCTNYHYVAVDEKGGKA